MDSQEEETVTLVKCCSKQAVETSCHMVLSTVFHVLDKSDYDEDFRERLKQRFKEVYENALHDNISVDGQTWSQALEEGNATKDYEPVNVELKKDITAKALALDELLVQVTSKRRTMPTEVTGKVTKRMKHLRHAAVHYTPLFNKLEIDASKLPIQVLMEESSQLKESGDMIASLSRNVPLLEDKASRLLEARELRSSMKNSGIYKVVSNPQTDESKMAISMTPLRHRLANETPSPIKKPTAKYTFGAIKVQNHPINTNFKLKSSSSV